MSINNSTAYFQRSSVLPPDSDVRTEFRANTTTTEWMIEELGGNIRAVVRSELERLDRKVPLDEAKRREVVQAIWRVIDRILVDPVSRWHGDVAILMRLLALPSEYPQCRPAESRLHH